MKAREHQAIGDEATAGAFVDLAVGASDEHFFVRHGDVIALSGDFFLADPSPLTAPASSGLFDLAAVPGDRGRMPGTRDELVCGLKVMAVDEDAPDARFEAGGEFADYELSPTATRSEVERRVRDRFLALAAANVDHFLAPWGDEPEAPQPGMSRFGSARAAYGALHRAALDEAWRLGRFGDDVSRAMAREAAAQHYLTDAFASGHLRTPIAAIRRFWHHRYPEFWESLQRKIAGDTARALREVARPLRLLSRRMLYDRTLSAVRARTRTYPPVSFGDLLGRVLHDWDNDHGLLLDTGAMLFGDGHLDEGVGRRMAVAAVRSGNDDVEVAYALGASGSRVSGEALYAAVRDASGAGTESFAAERLLPRPSPDNPPLNWRARDVDELWRSPIAGSTGTTIGAAVCQVLEVGGEVSRRLDCLGEGVVEAFDVLDVPVLRGWLGQKACQAYHRGFIEGLARDPRAVVAEVVEHAGDWASRDAAPAPV
ncbi:MAG: hypothetical protein ACRD12_18570 [Acidimicrobiales bacterium]